MAIERSGDPAEAGMLANLHQMRGQCYELGNRWDEAIACYRQMATVAASAGDRSQEGLALCLISIAQIYAHDLAEGDVTAQAAEAIGVETGDRDLVLLSQLSRVFNRTMKGDLDDPYARIVGLRDDARRVDDPFPRALGIDFAGEMLHFQGREIEALALIEEAQAIAESAQLGQPMSYVYFDLALTTLALGRYDDAFAAARRSIEHAERVGDQGFWWCRGKNTLGRIYIELGDAKQGELHNQQAADLALTFGDLETLRNAQLNIADCLLARGDAAGALQRFEALQREFDADDNPGEWMKWRYTMHLLASMSLTLHALGEFDRGLACAEQCIERAEATSAKRYLSKGRRVRGLALASLGRVDEGLASIDIALAVAKEIGGPEPSLAGARHTSRGAVERRP